MNDFLPTIFFLSAIGLGIIYWLVSARNGIDKASHESNVILRGLINDQKNEILSLRDRMHNVENKLTAVLITSAYLEKVVTMALENYFVQYPDAAKAAKDTIEAFKKDGEENG